MRLSRQLLVKVVLLRGHGYPRDNAMPYFFHGSDSSIQEISNEVLNFFQFGVVEEELDISGRSSPNRADILWLQCVA